jgi:hypothetical protein
VRSNRRKWVRFRAVLTALPECAASGQGASRLPPTSTSLAFSTRRAQRLGRGPPVLSLRSCASQATSQRFDTLPGAADSSTPSAGNDPHRTRIGTGVGRRSVQGSPKAEALEGTARVGYWDEPLGGEQQLRKGVPLHRTTAPDSTDEAAARDVYRRLWRAGTRTAGLPWPRY